MSNSKKVIVITGASQGLGAGMVKAFRALDYKVVATSRSIKPSTDPDIHTVAGDIGDPVVAQRVIREAIERFGRVDTLVNNAGIFVAKPFTAYTQEDYAAVLSVNLNGFFYITQLAITEMEKQGSGHVVSITTSLTYSAGRDRQQSTQSGHTSSQSDVSTRPGLFNLLEIICTRPRQPHC